MATEEAKVVRALPPPPAYFKLFGLEPLAASTRGDGPALASHRQSAAAAAEAEAAGRFPLQPPKPPGPGETYTMFGMPYSAEPVAEELLPPQKMVVATSGKNIDFRAELKGLLNSIVTKYCQFMDMLVSAPSRATEKLSDIEILFVNFHSLLNRYRAHQARHMILERLRSQAAENETVMSALRTAVCGCAAAKESATACLRVSNGAAPPEARTVSPDHGRKGEESLSGQGARTGGIPGLNGAAPASAQHIFPTGTGGSR